MLTIATGILFSPDVLIDVAGQILRMLHRRHDVLLVVLVIQSIKELFLHTELLRPRGDLVSRARQVLKNKLRFRYLRRFHFDPCFIHCPVCPLQPFLTLSLLLFFFCEQVPEYCSSRRGASRGPRR